MTSNIFYYFQTILSDLALPAPHVVNIDVESGMVTVESPQNTTDYLNAMHTEVNTVLSR